MNDTLLYAESGPGIIEAEPIAYSFATPGWYMVMALVLLLAVIAGLFRYARYRKNAYRRQAIREIGNILQEGVSNPVFQINLRLKIIALDIFGSERVAALTGSPWLEFLVSTAPGTSLPGEALQKLFQDTLYGTGKLSSEELDEFGNFAIQWIEKHDARKL